MIKTKWQIIYTFHGYNTIYTEKFDSCRKAYIKYDQIQEMFNNVLSTLELQEVNILKEYKGKHD